MPNEGLLVQVRTPAMPPAWRPPTESRHTDILRTSAVAYGQRVCIVHQLRDSLKGW
jgi:hypothetical protein